MGDEKNAECRKNFMVVMVMQYVREQYCEHATRFKPKWSFP